jgi:hypothetical protein
MERYKIPLIIYSSLLKKPKKINAVSTHLDLAPTILNYLKREYSMVLPDRVPFIGRELDLNEKYRCYRCLPMNSINCVNNAILHRSHFLFDGLLYKVGKNLKSFPCKDQKTTQKLLRQLIQYDKFSSYLHFNNRFLPENYFRKYIFKKNYKLMSEWNSENKATTSLKDEFIDIGSNIVLNKNVKTVKFIFTAEFIVKNIKWLDSIPHFTVSLENISSKGNELLAWKQAKPLLKYSFEAGKWNKVEFQCVLRLKDYKALKKANQLKYYLLNSKKKWIKIRNMKTKVFMDNN